MCKVVVENPQEKVGFIMYNHLYNRDKASFTVPELTKELRRYNLDLTDDIVQKEVDSFLCDGLVMRKFSGYTRTAML